MCTSLSLGQLTSPHTLEGEGSNAERKEAKRNVYKEPKKKYKFKAVHELKAPKRE